MKGDPKKSQGLAIFGSPIIFTIIIYILYASMYNVFGHDFIVAASVLFVNGKSPLPVIPSPAYLVSFITSSPILAFSIPFGLILNDFGFALLALFCSDQKHFCLGI